MVQGLLLQWSQQALGLVKELSNAAPGSVLTQTLVLGLGVGLLSYFLIRRSRYRLPPGPTPLPLLGNLLQMNSKEALYITLDRWTKERYGPVISVYLGPIFCVFINNEETFNEALIKRGKDFNGRPKFHSMDVLTEGSKDIAFTDYNPTWKLQRKIAMTALRHYMTGSRLDKVVHEVMSKAADKMAAESGAFDPHLYTSKIMFHVIDRISFGETRSFDDPTIVRLTYLFDEVNKDFGNGFYEDIFPLLKYWPTKSFRKFMEKNDEYLDYIKDNMAKRRQVFDPANITNMADSILRAQMEVEKEEKPEVMAMFTEVHVRQTISDLFGAGVDTSRITLDWAILFLARHPQIQKRAHAEIDAAMGTETGMPGAEQCGRMPYTQAVVWETMRMSPAVPFTLPHKTLCDTSVGGYDIPKDTMVMLNIWAVTHDSTLWDEPHEFKPERFLDDSGSLKPLPRAWVPFSAGGRKCLGEVVAKPELLLLVACLLHSFSFSLPEGATFDTTPSLGILGANMPPAYKVLAARR